MSISIDVDEQQQREIERETYVLIRAGVRKALRQYVSERNASEEISKKRLWDRFLLKFFPSWIRKRRKQR